MLSKFWNVSKIYSTHKSDLWFKISQIDFFINEMVNPDVDSTKHQTLQGLELLLIDPDSVSLFLAYNFNFLDERVAFSDDFKIRNSSNPHLCSLPLPLLFQSFNCLGFRSLQEKSRKGITELQHLKLLWGFPPPAPQFQKVHLGMTSF